MNKKEDKAILPTNKDFTAMQEKITATFGDSSLLLRADFDPMMDALTVYFKSGGIYTYVNVAREVFDEFRKSESAGKYFVRNIRDEYEFMKNA